MELATALLAADSAVPRGKNPAVGTTDAHADFSATIRQQLAASEAETTPAQAAGSGGKDVPPDGEILPLPQEAPDAGASEANAPAIFAEAKASATAQATPDILPHDDKTTERSITAAITIPETISQDDASEAQPSIPVQPKFTARDAAPRREAAAIASDTSVAATTTTQAGATAEEDEAAPGQPGTTPLTSTATQTQESATASTSAAQTLPGTPMTSAAAPPVTNTPSAAISPQPEADDAQPLFNGQTLQTPPAPGTAIATATTPGTAAAEPTTTQPQPVDAGKAFFDVPSPAADAPAITSGTNTTTPDNSLPPPVPQSA
ncbi:MAG TPA: hypothetical protein VNR18_06750, partial [Hyphomicrobiales bacterium]|nr:hypothetical protein [Hyphomicrobiales bacterium]